MGAYILRYFAAVATSNLGTHHAFRIDRALGRDACILGLVSRYAAALGVERGGCIDPVDEVGICADRYTSK